MEADWETRTLCIVGIETSVEEEEEGDVETGSEAVAAQEQTALADVRASSAVVRPQAKITQAWADAAIAELEAGLH
jgi:hypothetical protein